MQSVLSIYYQTLIHLKSIQIRYQLWYRIRHYWRKFICFRYPLFIERQGFTLKLKPFIQKYSSFKEYQFTFLNQSKTFPVNNIVWTYDGFGKLWTYNLNYFDYLLQPDLNPETGLELINDFQSRLNSNSTGIEPYPISLRGINWIKFYSKFSIQKPKFSYALYAQYQILLDNIEYHLLGNHLLENGFSLLFGAFFFKDEKLYNKAFHIIKSELNEQILDDGGHFELSPMYHQIILDRLLDCINLTQNNKLFDNQDSLLTAMIENALRMLQWINAMTFSNGQIPLMNDSANGIGPSTDQLNEYAIRLGILEDRTIPEIRNNSFYSYLNQSGYRRFNDANYECIIDIGQIGPTYQLGHAHADTLNFILNIKNQSIFIDSGISTYETNQLRLKERSTCSHNTITIKNENSSKVWSSFRVAKRAKVNILEDLVDKVIAEHNGFQIYQTTHQRQWEFVKDKITIIDSLEGHHDKGTAHFWLSHQLVPEILDNTVKVNNCIIEFENFSEIRLLKTIIPQGYNKYTDSNKIEVIFDRILTTTIKILNHCEDTISH